MSRSDKLSTYKTTVASGGNYTIVTYHRTQIVKYNSEEIILDFGGWDSVTTRRKMNQASRQFNLGYSVFRHKGRTYINSTNDLDVSQSVQYCGYPIIINRQSRGYGSVREVA